MKKMPPQPPPPDNPAFGTLPDLIRKAGLKLGTKPEPPPPPPPQRAHPVSSVQPSDEEVFDAAMDGVRRATWRHLPPPSEPPRPPAPIDTELQDRRLMQDAVNGIPESPVADHPEYIEGWVGVAGKKYLPNLRNGLYSIQAQIDLHGLSRDEARLTVEEFIEQMSRFRSCCVKIIHGRGMNSPNDRAVLKENLQRWLSSRRMARHVVAYASAQFPDGGVGALYVLLAGKRQKAGRQKAEDRRQKTE